MTNNSELPKEDAPVMVAPDAPPEPPPVAGEQPPVEEAKDPAVVGALEPNEISNLNRLRSTSQNLTMELGKLVIRGARLLGDMDGLEKQSEALLAVVGKRIGIPEGIPWQVSMNGDVRVLQDVPPDLLKQIAKQQGDTSPKGTNPPGEG